MNAWYRARLFHASSVLLLLVLHHHYRRHHHHQIQSTPLLALTMERSKHWRENLQNKQLRHWREGGQPNERASVEPPNKKRNKNRKKRKRFKNDFSPVVLSDWHFKIIIWLLKAQPRLRQPQPSWIESGRKLFSQLMTALKPQIKQWFTHRLSDL